MDSPFYALIFKQFINQHITYLSFENIMIIMIWLRKKRPLDDSKHPCAEIVFGEVRKDIDSEINKSITKYLSYCRKFEF